MLTLDDIEAGVDHDLEVGVLDAMERDASGIIICEGTIDSDETRHSKT